MVIRASDRVAGVLRRDERLLQVFVDASPHFERLRNPAMRRVMARLVTVEQAARIAGVELAALLDRLNAAVAESPSDAPRAAAAADAPVPAAAQVASAAETPPALAGSGPERWLDVDVREDLRNGREPFARIMDATRALPEGHILRIRAIFEPAPLYAALGKQGFAHWTERLADDDWRVWFYREAAPDGASAGPADGGTALGAASPSGMRRSGAEPSRIEPPGIEACAIDSIGIALVGIDPPADGAEDVVVLDVRGLEPPEPMARTLAALESLPPGATLVQLNVRVPRFLLPRLEEMGFHYEVREQTDDLVRLFIRRGDSGGDREF